MEGLRAVVFDLFETLISEFGIGHPTTADAASVLDCAPAILIEGWDASRKDRFSGRIRSLQDVYVQIGNSNGIAFPQKSIEELVTKREEAFTAHFQRIDEPILQMLEGLKVAGVKIGLLSNTDGSEVRSWSMSPLARYIDVATFSHECGSVKPDLASYENVIRELEVAAEDCIYIGDGNSDELVGAEAAGMKAFCAAWFLEQHLDILGDDIIAKRAKHFPVLKDPAEVLGPALFSNGVPPLSKAH